jgi:hypothetical protein
MADHVITTIRDAIRFGLSTIREGTSNSNGYTYKRTIRHIAKSIEDPEHFSQLDAVVIFMVNDICQNSITGQHTQSGANKAILENYCDVSFVCFMQEANDIEKAQDDKLADLQSYFGTYYYVPSSSGQKTCFNCIYLESQKFGYGATKPNCGIEVKFRFWYRQQLENPTILV